MGISVNPIVIVGIPLSELVKIEKTEEQYDVYDKRGNKTGETGVDITYRFSLKKNGKEMAFTQENDKIYSDSFEEFGLEEYPSDGKFGIFTTNYDSNDFETFIVGVKLLEVNAMYTDEMLSSINLDKVTEAMFKVKNILSTDFSVYSHPKLYLYGNASY